MIVKKVTTEKLCIAKNGKSLKTLGIVLFFMAFIYLIMTITEDPNALMGFNLHKLYLSRRAKAKVA